MRFGFQELLVITCIVALFFGPALRRWWQRMQHRQRQQEIRAQQRAQALQAQRHAQMMRLKMIACSVLGAVLLCLGAYLCFWPVAYPAQPYQFAQHEGTQWQDAGERITLEEAALPIALKDCGVITDLHYHNEWIYAALAKGEIVRVRADGTGLTSLVSTGGAILSFDFDADENIVFTDASYEGKASGVYRASFDGFAVTVEAIVSIGQGTALSYPSGVVVAPDGAIYFTDATEIAPLEHGGVSAALRSDLLAHTRSGVLYCYTPETKELACIAKGIPFAASLALSPDAETLYVAAFADASVYAVPCDVRDVSLTDGVAAGQITPLITELPGYPAQIAVRDDGIVYVSLFMECAPWREGLSENTLLRDVALRLPLVTQRWLVRFTGPAHMLALTEHGEVRATYQSEKANARNLVTAFLPLPEGLYFTQMNAQGISLAHEG